MRLGIAGLPNVGRGTPFDAITSVGAESANYPFCVIDPDVDVVVAPNHRLNALTEIYHPKKIIPAVVEFVDIVGLVKGTSKGQGLGNRFLANIRECDAIVHVVCCFDGENIVHMIADTSTNAPMDPAGNIGAIDIELIMADVGMVKHRIDRVQKTAKGDKKYLRKVEVFSAPKDWLNNGNSARSFDCDGDGAAVIVAVELLSLKPIVYAAGLDEEGFTDCHANAYYKVVEELTAERGAQVIPVCVKLKAGVAKPGDEEKKMFPDDLGIAKSDLDWLIRASYALLGLISFFISDEDECCVWTIKRGVRTPQAVGKIHTDFEWGFIRAEVVNFDDLMACGSMNVTKEKGLVRSGGKGYIMKGGDTVLFRFNV